MPFRIRVEAGLQPVLEALGRDPSLPYFIETVEDLLVQDALDSWK